MDHPLSEELDRYLASLRDERRLQKSTLALYELELKTLLLLTPTPLAGMVKTHLKPLAPATQWRKLVIWRAFLGEARSPWKELLSEIKTPKLRQKQPIFLTEDEAFRLETVCYKTKEMERNRLLVGLALQLGLRLSEILNLKFKDCEDGAWLRIIRKGGKEQRLPLTPTLQTLIQFWRSKIFAKDDDWVFQGRGFDPMSPRMIQILLKQLAKMAGIEKKISPHSLRHTFATTLASRGANLAALKELLGHEKLSTTERYLHVTPSHLRETLGLLHR